MSKVSDYTAVSDLTEDDILYLVRYVDGKATSKKISAATLKSQLMKMGGIPENVDVLKREIMAPYSYSGISLNIDQLREWIKSEAWDQFAIGDYVDITLTTGEQVREEITDKNPYIEHGDTPLEVPHVCLVPRDCLKTTYQYNSSNTNSGGYAGSLMPANMEAIFVTLPTTVRSHCLTVRRLENNKGAWAWASRNMFLLTNEELLGHQGMTSTEIYSNGSPVQHALFRGKRHVMKGAGFEKSVSTRVWYWTADPSSFFTTDFCILSIAGGSDGYGASGGHYVCPAIVLGA